MTRCPVRIAYAGKIVVYETENGTLDMDVDRSLCKEKYVLELLELFKELYDYIKERDVK